MITATHVDNVGLSCCWWKQHGQQKHRGIDTILKECVCGGGVLPRAPKDPHYHSSTRASPLPPSIYTFTTRLVMHTRAMQILCRIGWREKTVEVGRGRKRDRGRGGEKEVRRYCRRPWPTFSHASQVRGLHKIKLTCKVDAMTCKTASSVCSLRTLLLFFCFC